MNGFVFVTAAYFEPVVGGGDRCFYLIRLYCMLLCGRGKGAFWWAGREGIDGYLSISIASLFYFCISSGRLTEIQRQFGVALANQGEWLYHE